MDANLNIDFIRLTNLWYYFAEGFRRVMAFITYPVGDAIKEFCDGLPIVEWLFDGIGTIINTIAPGGTTLSLMIELMTTMMIIAIITKFKELIKLW